MVVLVTTKISSRGQIVIPKSLRENYKEGEELAIIKGDKNELILKKSIELAEEIKEDLKFRRRTEAARREIEKGNWRIICFSI